MPSHYVTRPKTGGAVTVELTSPNDIKARQIIASVGPVRSIAVMMQDDPRMQLMPVDRNPVWWAHRWSTATQPLDSLAGPLSSPLPAGANPVISGFPVIRAAAEESDVNQPGTGPFMPYENGASPPPSSDASRLRTRLQTQLETLSDEHDELLAGARKGLSMIVDGLFSHALCSMQRVVLSARLPETGPWTSVSIRNTEKKPGVPIDLALVRAEEDGQLVGFVPEGKQVTSSAMACYAFHRIARPGYLINARVLAPILWDEPIEGMQVIDIEPRTVAFGEKLHWFFYYGAEAVLRRGDGLWVYHQDPEVAIRNLLKYQALTIRKLIAARAS